MNSRNMPENFRKPSQRVAVSVRKHKSYNDAVPNSIAESLFYGHQELVKTGQCRGC